MNELAEQVETTGSRERNHAITECRIGLSELSKASPAVESMGDSRVDHAPGALQGNDATQPKQEYCETVGHFGTFGTIPERENGDDEKNSDVELENNIEDGPTDTVKVHEREGILTRVFCGRLGQLYTKVPPKLVCNLMAVAHHRVLTRKKAR